MRPGEWSFLDAMWRWGGFATDAGWAQAAGRVAIDRLRQERLSRLLAWTRRHSRYYAARWGSQPRRDLCLRDLPPVHKADLMARFDDWVTDPAVTRKGVEAFTSDLARIGQPMLGRYAVFASSGTTGVPGFSVHDCDALAVYDALGATRMGALAPAWNWGEPLTGHRYALIAATEGHFAGIVSWERLRALHPWFEANARVFPVTAPIRETCAELERFRPTVVASYATVLRALAHERDAGRLEIEPSVLWYGGEWLAPMARAHIERAFGCRVAGDYGASEFLNIAFECERGSLHLNDDWVVLEPVDENYEPVPPDEASASVLLTNLANHVQPLVRYELGDSVTVVSKPCACGRPFPVIRVDGRRDEILSPGRREGPRRAGHADGALHGGGGGRGRAPLPGRADGAGRAARAPGERLAAAQPGRAREGRPRAVPGAPGARARRDPGRIRRDRRPPRERQVPPGLAREAAGGEADGEADGLGESPGL